MRDPEKPQAIIDAAIQHEAREGVARQVPSSARLSIEEVVARAAELLPTGTPSSVGLIREMRDQRAAVLAPVAQASLRRKRK